MKNNKKIIVIILSVVLVAVAVVALCIGLRVASAANHALRISKLLQPMLDAENQAMHITASTQINGNDLNLESDIFLITEEGRKYLCLDQNGKTIYVADNVLFFENGKAFKIGEKMQRKAESYQDFLPQIGILFEALSVAVEETENKTDYCVTVTGEQVEALLAAATVGESLPTDSIEKLELCLTERNGKLEEITFSGMGEMKDTSIMLDVTVSGFRVLASGDYPIPEAVKQSAATVDPEELFSLTEDLLRLVLALDAMADMDSIGGVLDLTVDCGLLQLDTQIELSDLNTASDIPIDPAKLQALPEVLVWLCMEGEITGTQNGDAHIYKLVLDQAAMEKLLQMLLPEFAQYSGDFTEGSVSITLNTGKIKSMGVSIEGKIQVLIVKMPITVGAEFIFD